MPLEVDDQARVDEAIRESGANPSDDRVLVRNTPESQKLGPGTVMCTILNRTIGSGIFVTPAIVLRSTSSVGVSLLFWSFGAIIGMSALLIWLELGLSIPKFELPNRDENDTVQGEGVSLQCVPRNGGEKNYLEYIYRFPKMRATTCIFGWIYIILGNLSGNAVAFGIYICQAADIEGRDPLVRGLAVVCLTAACLLHASWRKGGIIVNNLLAIMKVLVLVAIIIIGFAASAGASFGHGPVHGETVDPKTQSKTSNFSTHSSFAFASNDPASYAESLLYIIFTYSGYEQPFYVLSEVYRPKKTFAMSTIAGQGLACCLFVLVNVAYLCAVSVDQRLDGELDMATVFFRQVFSNQIAPRVMSGIIALSIFGNIVVMTFTASRAPETAYTVLVSLYSYSVVTLLGFFVSGGLLYLRLFSSERHEWISKSGFKPWGGATAAMIYTATCLFLVAARFIPPSSRSPFAFGNTGVQWYIIPTVGLASFVLGIMYYLGFEYVYPPLFKDGKVLIVDREAVIVREHGEYVQALEVVDASWERKSGPGSNDTEMQKVTVAD
ncbi:MAG: hypothetical protein L6R37_005906 [Teloschistes peruensis]|nr:MAG: hypothetical protein L6R37_005906 [Teloschistes peruensis]